MDTSNLNKRSNPVILLLSDIQFGSGCVFETKELMFEKLIADISRYSLENIPWPNIIVVAGDVIDKGSIDRYDNALWLIKELANYIHINPSEYRSRIVVIPGNHDVKREIADAQPQYKLMGFERFCMELYGAESSPFSFDRDRHYAIFKIDGQKPLVFIALNSCEKINSQNFEGYISPNIVVDAIRAAKDSMGNRSATYVAVFHHNAVALETNDRLVNFYTELKDLFIRGGITLCLHGHIHNQHVEEFSTGDFGKSLITIAAGSLGISADQRPSKMGMPVPNQYSIIRLDSERMEGALHVRQYRPELSPIDNNDLTQGRWQEYRVFKVNGSDSSKYNFSLRSRGFIAPAALYYASNARHVIGGKGELISFLMQTMKPSQRLVDVIGIDANSALAVDDGFLFMRSDLQIGWRPEQIDLEFGPPIELSPEFQMLAQKQKINMSLPNKTKYMIRSIVPPIIDKSPGNAAIKIHLVPISYFDIHGVELALDELMVSENKTVRQLFFKDHLLFNENNRLPNKVVIHLLVVTGDQKFLLLQRSRFVEFQNAQWSATFEEQMQGDHLNEITGILDLGDEDFFATAVRGMREELGIMVDRRAITFLGIASEWENLAYNVIGIVNVDLGSEDIIAGWKLHAPDKAEHSRIIALPFEQDFIYRLLQNDRVSVSEYGIENDRWHPTSRIRILLGALHRLP